MTILFSSGMGGGTGAPEILMTASKREGHTSKQMPHASHFSWSMMWIVFFAPSIAPAGHSLRQIKHALHFSGSI
jgi:hypothetical protein